jgi:outer membrane receptor protein involved in Fe transport
LAFLFGLLIAAPLIWAQAETGRITGTVRNASGAAVPQAAITAKNLDTGAIRSTEGTGEGTYLIPNVTPGNYEVTITAHGLSAFKQRVTVAVGSPATVDAKMAAGAATPSAAVAENSVAVNRETQSLATVVTTEQVTELPSLTRNPYDFIGTVPSVSPADPSGRGVGYAMNGLRAAGTNVLLDGVGNNNEFTGSVGQPVPLDSVQGYSVTTGAVTAEVGRADTGVVDVATKSGGNAFHGTGFEFYRVSGLASNSFYSKANRLPQGSYDRNQLGYSLGGPLTPNKLFFFQNTEGVRVRSDGNRVAWVPTQQFINASNTNTQQFFAAYGALRSGLTTLATYTKAQLAALGQNPCAGASATGACNALASATPLFSKVSYTAPADAGGGTPQNTYNVLGRIDYNSSEKSQIYLRYAMYHESDSAGTLLTSPYNGYDTGQTEVDDAAVVSGTHTFSPTLVSQTKLGYSRLNISQPLGAAAVGPTLYMNASAPTTIQGTDIALPGYGEYSPGTAVPSGGPQNFFTANEDVSKVWGKHSFRLGGQFTYFRDNHADGAYQNAVAALGANFGKSMDNFLTGQLNTFEAAVNPQGELPGGKINLPLGQPAFARSNRYKDSAWYAQDSWKMTPRLTVNLGVRWEYYGVQHDKNAALDSNYYYGSGSSIFQQIRNGQVYTVTNSPNDELWIPSKTNFAPRVGFAWDPKGDGKTSLRGGYGMGYERNFGNVTFNVIGNPPNYAVIGLTAGVDQPTIPISTSNSGPFAGSSGSMAMPNVNLWWVDPNIKQAYAHLYNLSLERQLSPGILGSLSYSGSAGENLYSIRAVNKAGSGNAYLGDACTPGANGNPGTCTERLRATQYNNISQATNGGSSTYNAMIARVTFKNLAKYGLTLDANYTFSRAKDNLSGTFSDGNQAKYELGFMDPFDPALDRGLSDFNSQSRLAISGVWKIPVFRGNSLQEKILGGWEIAPIFTARTGSPITLYDCANSYNYCPRAFIDGTVPTSGATNVPSGAGPDNYNFLNLSSLKITHWYNPKYGISDFGPFPSDLLGRNTINTPGNWNLDVGIYKNTKINEKVALQLRLEAYNVFNHANFYVHGTDVDVSSYSFVDGYRNGNRNLQLGAKILF